MSFLTPLYIAGLLAVSLPLVLHLVRRAPRGRFTFSSLMFLSPSPPRLTRRSRLDHLLLLLLRGLALALLALAFARPFWRQSAQLGLDQIEGRRVAVLLDTSASMRRERLWRQASAEVEHVLGDLGPGDDAALFTFDADVVQQVGFGGALFVDPNERRGLLAARLEALSPTWHESNLGEALVFVAEELHQLEDAKDAPTKTIRQIVLVSDLQEGSRLDALQAFLWPDDVQLALRTVAPAERSNAGLHLAADRRQYGYDQDPRLRVRVSNDRNSTIDQFELRWQNIGSGKGRGESGERSKEGGEPRSKGANRSPPAAEPVRVYVPPGESRVVRVPRPSETSTPDRLRLFGDQHPFDNTLHLAPIQQQEVSLLYLGSDAADDPQGLRYYLQRAFLDVGEAPEEGPAGNDSATGGPSAADNGATGGLGAMGGLPALAGQAHTVHSQTVRRQVHVVAREPDGPLSDDDLRAVCLVVVGGGMPDGRATQLRQYVEGGGTVFCVLTDAAAAGALSGIMGAGPLEAEEAPAADYAMLADIVFTHPLLAIFADPRFNDFTKIHFWKHRRVSVEDAPDLQVLARFDDGAPALFEQTRGQGRLLVLTSGWHPRDSDLARSTKFVPLLARVLDESGVAEPPVPQYRIGDPVELGGARRDVRPSPPSVRGSGAVRGSPDPAPAAARSGDLRRAPPDLRRAVVHKPDGTEWKLAAGARVFRQTDLPGVYSLAVGERQEHFAVNLAPEESKTAPLEPGVLEELGVRLGREPTRAELVHKHRQMRNAELERQQKLWRWLIAAALAVLVVETWLAGRLGRALRDAAPTAATSG